MNYAYKNFMRNIVCCAMRKTKISTKKPNPIYSLAISYLITIHNCITGTHILHKTVKKVKSIFIYYPQTLLYKYFYYIFFNAVEGFTT